MRHHTARQHPCTYKRGFNLVEAAIVLGVIGLVIGGIWIAASAFHANHKLNRNNTHMLQMAESMRHLYTGNGALIQVFSGDNLTRMMRNAGVIPASMPLNGTVTMNDFGGLFQLQITGSPSTPGSPITQFYFRYWGLNFAECINFLVSAGRLAERYRVVSITAGTGSYVISGGTFGSSSSSNTSIISTFPITPALASTSCLGINNSARDGYTSVYFSL